MVFRELKMEYIPCLIYATYIFLRNTYRYSICRYEGKVEGLYYTFYDLKKSDLIEYDSNLFIVSVLMDRASNFSLFNYQHFYKSPDKIMEITDYEQIHSFRTYKDRNSIIPCKRKVPENHIVRIYSYSFPEGIYFCPDTKTVTSREDELYYYSILLHKYGYDYVPVFILYFLIFSLLKTEKFLNSF